MSSKVGLIYSPAYENYSFGPDHPFNSKRITVTMDLLKEAGVVSEQDLILPEPATLEQLLLVHNLKYIEEVQRLSQTPGGQSLAYGLGSEDTPVFLDMHQVSSLVVGGTLQAVKMVMEGNLDHGVNLAGGLHHAQRGKASGFCIYNDVSVALAYLQREYGARIAYIDIDAHHGDGVQEAFYDNPNVMTISFHETGRYLFPGTGYVNERGIGQGYGYSVNVPLDAFTEDGSWLKVFETVVPGLIEGFKPDIIVTQNGCDAHMYDPLTHLCLTTRAFEGAYRLTHQLAHEYCGGRLVAVGGGGYDYWRVVPRAWSLLWAEIAERALPREIPQAWLERWEPQSNTKLPRLFLDNPSQFTPIPRRQQIEEKNDLTLRRVLDGMTYQLAKY